MMYTVYSMAQSRGPSAVLTIRVPVEVGKQLRREARRQRRTRSEVARELIEAGLAGARSPDPHAEARRQSKLAAASAAESEYLQFVVDAADLRGWK